VALISSSRAGAGTGGRAGGRLAGGDPGALSGGGDALVAGRDALSRGAWAEARSAFEAALERRDDPAAWEGLGWAAWWLCDEALTFRARQRAFRGYRSLGDCGSAGRVAAWIAADHREIRGDDAVGRGWLQRAHRLLDPLPESPDHGWLALHEGSYALNVHGDPEAAASLARRAARIGRDGAVADLEAIGLAQEGIAEVICGRVAQGMRHLDEASAIAAVEELQLPLSQGWALCYLIAACDGVGDLPRARQWCDAMRVLAERWSGRQLMGVCRSAYGRVLATSGDWSGGEGELVAALRDLEASRPAQAGSALARLGELRARQGRTDEARRLFARAGTDGLLGLGALALDDGDAAAAADMADRVLRRLAAPDVLGRLPALELLVRARVARGDRVGATTAFEELAAAANQVGTPYVLGRARLVAIDVSLSLGAADAARQAAEDAIDRLTESCAPFEAAVARLGLARALRALGRESQAIAEARAARDAFAELGAERALQRAEAALATLPARPAALPARAAASPPAASPPDSVAELSARELEVLRLVAQGLADGEIARRLVLSPHTVHRHVANVRTKLRLPSRTAAVAHAARAGVL
jgi:DNA-binding CsgD family transcriptional regulator